MKGKRLSILISGILILSIGLSGCSKDKTMIFDLNAETDKGMELNITNEIIAELGENKNFIPSYFDVDKVYGTYRYFGDTIYPERAEGNPRLKYFYTLDFDGNINKTNKELINYLELRDMEGIDGNRYPDTKDNNIYYYNNKSGEKRKISENVDISDKVYKIKDETGFDQTLGTVYKVEKLVEGNSDYAYIMDSQEYVKEEINKLIRLEIINLKSNTKSIYEGGDMPCINEIIYSKLTDNIYALDLDGGLYKITLNEGKIEFKKEGIVNRKKSNYFMNDDISVNKSGEIVVLNRDGDDDTLAIIYNPKTKVSKNINKNENEKLSVEIFFPESNRLILKKVNNNDLEDKEFYVGELKGDLVKIYTKLDVGGYKDINSSVGSVIESEDGKRILVEIYFTNTDKNSINSGKFIYNLITIN